MSVRELARRCGLLALVLLVGGGTGVAQQQPSSVADAAKRSAAKPKAKKVITDDDIVPSATSSKSEGSQASAAKPADSPQPYADAKPYAEAKSGSEKAEKDAAAATPKTDADRIAELKRDQDVYKANIEKFRAKLESETDESRIATYRELLQHMQQRLGDNQKEMDKLQPPPKQ